MTETESAGTPYLKISHSTDPDFLDQEAQSDDYIRHYYVAQNKYTHPDTLHRIAVQHTNQTPEPHLSEPGWNAKRVLPLQIALKIAENPNTAHDTLKHLAKHGNFKIHLFLANTSRNPEILRQTYNANQTYHNANHGIFIQRSMAENPATPSDILEHISGEILNDQNHHTASDEILTHLAKHKNATPNVLRNVNNANRDNVVVTGRLVRHKNTPHDVLNKIIEQHPHDYVSKAITDRKDIPSEMLDRLARSKRNNENDYYSNYGNIIRHRNTSLKTLNYIKKNIHESDPAMINTIYAHVNYPFKEASNYFAKKIESHDNLKVLREKIKSNMIKSIKSNF